MAEDQIQIRVWVSGRVQGVGYRAHTARAAQGHGDLKGWVRNLTDGRVEAVFCGPPSQVKAMVDWCRRGPELAQVTGVESSVEPVDSHLDSFQVRY